jgi:hypothetical protein
LSPVRKTLFIQNYNIVVSKRTNADVVNVWFF